MTHPTPRSRILRETRAKAGARSVPGVVLRCRCGRETIVRRAALTASSGCRFKTCQHEWEREASA